MDHSLALPTSVDVGTTIFLLSSGCFAFFVFSALELSSNGSESKDSEKHEPQHPALLLLLQHPHLVVLHHGASAENNVVQQSPQQIAVQIPSVDIAEVNESSL